MPVKPPFGTLNATLAKTIAANAPKDAREWVEPFGDGGTMALYLAKRRPRQHVVNVVDETLFSAFTFVQTASGGDLAALKRMDWVASQEAFDAAVSIAATEGVEFFYRFLYVKKFGMQMDPEMEPVFDVLSTGDDGAKYLWGLPLMRAGLKGVELQNGDPMPLVGGGGFNVLLPKKPEDVEAVRSRLSGIGGPFFFAAKVLDAQEIIDLAGQLKGLNVTALTVASIMMNDMATVWNYESRLVPLLDVIEAGAAEHSERHAEMSRKSGTAPSVKLPAAQTKREGGNGAAPRFRATVERLWTRQVEKQEADFAETMGRFFRGQAAEVGRQLKLVMDEAPSLFGAPGAASQVAERIFRPRDWDEALRKAAGVPMLKGALAGYLGAKALWEVRGRKDLTPQELEWINNWTIPESVKARIKTWLGESFAQPYWSGVNDTTRTAIEHTLGYGLREGQSLWDMANGIQAIVGDTDKKRAWRIARTESTGSLSAGAVLQGEELEQAGLVVVKTWVTMGDDLVRETHAALEGVQVDGTKGLFSVGGYMAPYPGHLSLPGKEKINCRCGLYHDTVEAKERPAPTTEEQVAAEEAGMTETATEPPADSPASSVLSLATANMGLPDVLLESPERVIMRLFEKLRGTSGGTVGDLAAMSGAPQGASLKVRAVGTLLHTEATGQFGHASTVIGRDLDGRLVQTVHAMEVKQTGTGAGTKALARMVDAGRRMGVEALKLDALRAPWANGYYTWARLGFDAPLPPKWLEQFAGKLPKGLENVARVSDLMRTKAGRKFWKDNGATILMEFATAPSSLSSRVLEAYVAAKMKRKEW